MNKYSQHEAQDRAHLIAEVFDRQLLQHPYVASDPVLLEQCRTIADQLGTLYQAIGQSE